MPSSLALVLRLLSFRRVCRCPSAHAPCVTNVASPHFPLFLFLQTVLFHSVKQLAVQENIALFAAVLICAALLLAVAYRAWAVYGSRRYMHRSDLLTRTFTKPETDARVTAIHHMGRVFAIALVNVAYIALAFICSFQRIFGRFELSSFVYLLFCSAISVVSHVVVFFSTFPQQCVCSDGGCSCLCPRLPRLLHDLKCLSFLAFPILFPPLLGKSRDGCAPNPSTKETKQSSKTQKEPSFPFLIPHERQSVIETARATKKGETKKRR